jgi:hypothetical protein
MRSRSPRSERKLLVPAELGDSLHNISLARCDRQRELYDFLGARVPCSGVKCSTPAASRYERERITRDWADQATRGFASR